MYLKNNYAYSKVWAALLTRLSFIRIFWMLYGEENFEDHVMKKSKNCDQKKSNRQHKAYSTACHKMMKGEVTELFFE